MKETITINGSPAYVNLSEGARIGLIVLEEIWGVNDHVRSVADRFAAEGFAAVSPELLPAGLLAQLTPELQRDLFDPEKRNALQPTLRAAMQPISQPEYATGAIATLKASVDYLLSDAGVSSVAVLGFCFGGTYSFHLAAHDARVKAAVPFYGHAPSDDEIAQINCPVLAFYGDQDAALMESLPAVKESMQRHGKQFEAVVYAGAGHAFFNDTNERMYRPENAADAWQKTLAFIGAHCA